ncbi:MAG TPA: 50S ribosomal protein L21 [Bacteroidetes bacterium]|nr:50S ribosomal protein L21 [Bacteroidota bacterium]
MYAVVEIGGHQYKVKKDQVLFVDKQNVADNKLSIDRVFLVANDKDIKVGTPVVAGAKVEATVLETVKADKLIIFKKKRRKGYQKKTGHRQKLSQIRIDNIIV